MQETVKKREYSMDFIKITATIIIVFHHYQQLTNARFHVINFFGGQFYFGQMVELFFVISGYFTFHYVKRISEGLRFGEFIGAKLKRLIPLLAITVAADVIFKCRFRLLYGHWLGGVKPTVWAALINAIGIQDGWVSTNPLLNNPTWYLSVLILCYIVFFLVTYLCNRNHVPHIYFFVFIIFVGLGIQTYSISVPFFNPDTVRGYYSFFFGLLFVEAVQKYKFNSIKSILISTFLFLGLLCMIIFEYNFVSYGINYLLTFIMYPSMIIIFRSNFFNKVFRSWFWGTWGKNIFQCVYVACPPIFVDVLHHEDFQLEPEFRQHEFHADFHALCRTGWNLVLLSA